MSHPTSKERGIPFTGEQVRATLDGRMTQTRRIVHPRFEIGLWDLPRGKEDVDAGYPFVEDQYGDSISVAKLCPYGRPGDRLYVRETTCIAPKFFATPDDSCLPDLDGDLRYVSYRADGHDEEAMRDYGLKWTPSIFMPRWASRILLEITDIWVERVTEISIEDIHAEGVACSDCWTGGTPYKDFPHEDHCGCASKFYNLWQSINGNKPGCSWEDRPFVWVISFKRIEP